ncbi:unnamed protein product [Merluccius merluccius]
MAREQDVERIAKKLDKMVHKKNTEGAADLLKELKTIHMSLETLQSTRVGMCVNAVRKQSSDEEVQTLAKTLIKSWKKLLDGADGKVEEKKREGSPMRSSSTSKDSGPGEKSSKKSEDLPATPTAAPRVTSFPPAPVTTDTVRTKCRDLLVAALETDGGRGHLAEGCQQVRLDAGDRTQNLVCVCVFSLTPGPLIFQEFHSTEVKYKSRLRSRISNLKDQKNPELRRSVLCGHISPQQIATMSAQEMASKELKMVRESLTKESIREHQLSKVGGTETDMFICGKCRGKNCSYTQVQTRSADEPMTTFVLCNGCGNRWKVRNQTFTKTGS